MAEPQRSKSHKRWRQLSTIYKTRVYRLLGSRMETDARQSHVADMLRQARMDYTPGLYRSLVVASGVLASTVSFAVYILIFAVAVGTPDWPLFVVCLTALTGTLGFGLLPMTARMRISNVRVQIDKELPYTLSELSIMASTGLSPVETIRRMSRRNVNPHMKDEFGRIVYKIDIEGRDIITALGEAARETPSVNLREILWDFANLIHQGGDLDVYLRAKADEILRLKRDVQKEFIDKLGSYLDIYISLTLVGALLGGIGAFMLDATGSTLFGLDGTTALSLLAYLILPAIVGASLLMISVTYAKTE
jgi:archaellum biogenesis protein FlaJ (TadC family)